MLSSNDPCRIIWPFPGDCEEGNKESAYQEDMNAQIKDKVSQGHINSLRICMLQKIYILIHEFQTRCLITVSCLQQIIITFFATIFARYLSLYLCLFESSSSLASVSHYGPLVQMVFKLAELQENLTWFNSPVNKCSTLK